MGTKRNHVRATVAAHDVITPDTPVIKAEVLAGVCTNCEHADECRHRLASVEPVQFCDEHSVAGAAAVPTDGDAPRPAVVVGRGLCLNCDHRETCVHADLEVGVWHCEEYC